MKKISDPIDQRERKQGSISDLLDNYMSKFVVHESPRLMDLYDETKLLRQKICPICLCKLYTDLKGNVMCKSAKHKKITKKRLYITSKGFEKFK